MKKQVFLGLIGAFVMNSSYALTLTINDDGKSIGQKKQILIKKGESLSTVAKRYGVALREVIAANPNMTSGKRLAAGTRVNIPFQYLLPSGPRNGIVLNLAELRIYFFHPDGTQVSTYPVAAGKQGWSTPQGKTTIVAKERNPAWRPPKSIQREAARSGRRLPLVIPPGPHNPLGRYAIRLGMSGILIHGTNRPGSIGTRSSHGCVRMYAKDIEELFNSAAVGTDVYIVHETRSQILAKQQEAEQLEAAKLQAEKLEAEKLQQAAEVPKATEAPAVEVPKTAEAPKAEERSEHSPTAQVTEAPRVKEVSEQNQTTQTTEAAAKAGTSDPSTITSSEKVTNTTQDANS